MTRHLLTAAMLAALLPTAAQAQVTRIKSNPQAVILDAAKVAGGSELLFVSGQLASPVDPTKPMTEIKSVEDLGDTKSQTISVLGKIKRILEAQGYTLADTRARSSSRMPGPVSITSKRAICPE